MMKITCALNAQNAHNTHAQQNRATDATARTRTTAAPSRFVGKRIGVLETMGRTRGAVLVALLLFVDLAASFDRSPRRFVCRGPTTTRGRSLGPARAVGSAADLQAGASDAVSALTQALSSARLAFPLPATVDWAAKGDALLRAAINALPPTVPAAAAEALRFLQASGLATAVGYVLGGAGIVVMLAMVGKLMARDPIDDDAGSMRGAPPPGQPYGPANAYDAALAAAYFARRPAQVRVAGPPGNASRPLPSRPTNPLPPHTPLDPCRWSPAAWR